MIFADEEAESREGNWLVCDCSAQMRGWTLNPHLSPFWNLVFPRAPCSTPVCHHPVFNCACVLKLSSLQPCLLNPWEEDVCHMPATLIAKDSKIGFSWRRFSFSMASRTSFKVYMHHLCLERKSEVGLSIATDNHSYYKNTFQFKLITASGKRPFCLLWIIGA